MPPSKKMRFLDDTRTLELKHNATPQVLAAGLYRCATSSLQLAFETYFDPPFAPSMHGAYVMPHVSLMKLCSDISREPSAEKRQKMLRPLFQGYEASSDYPGMAFTEDLLDMYPDIKVVLNKRSSARAWMTSVHSSLRFFGSWKYLVLTYWVPQSYWHWRVYRDFEIMVQRRFGSHIDMWSEEFYEAHNEWVRDACRKRGKEWLEWEPSMGWDWLCKFIGRPVPDRPFPQTNEGAEIEKLKKMLVLRGVVVWVAVLAVPVAVGVLTQKLGGLSRMFTHL